MSEIIAIGSDHAGFTLKERLKRELASRGYELQDVGTFSDDSTDYPDYAHHVAEAVAGRSGARGILLCGTGIGMAMSANRHPGVRAAVVWNQETAVLSRQHNDANVLALPARFLSEDEAVAILDAWLSATFEGGRHERRVKKIEVSTHVGADE